MTDKLPRKTAPRVLLECSWCPTKFEVRQSRLKHMTGNAYCSRECMLKGRVKTRKEAGSYKKCTEALLRGQAASQEKVLCSRGCGLEVVKANESRHSDSCFWPRSWERFAELGKLLTDGECLVWQGAGAAHYGVVGREHAHREAWRISNNNAEIPEDLVVRHTCDRKGCVQPTHLILGTSVDNRRDAMDRGRSKGTFDTWPKDKLQEMLKTRRWPQVGQ